MPRSGWKELLAGSPWFEGDGKYPIAAYSEYMPPPRFGRKPYRHAPVDSLLFAEDDPWGWHVTEFEEANELRPGLERLACTLLRSLAHLGRGEKAHGIAPGKLADNPCWPDALAGHAGKLAHERYVLLLPVALSRTQDDKGRLRWTLFGASEQGPARAFWRSFYRSPKEELPTQEALGFFCRLLASAYGEKVRNGNDLHRAGFRILPQAEDPPHPWWGDGPLPSWATPYLWSKSEKLKDLTYLLTFRPFEHLPGPVQKAYLAGSLHLLPFPGSLLFWGIPGYAHLQNDLPLALQVPLLHFVSRHEGPGGLRIPQAGWLHEASPGEKGSNHHGPVRNTFKRTHRWARVLRDEDELALLGQEDKLLHVLFSTIPDDLGLYSKPMARNVQVWGKDFTGLLDGPSADADAIKRAMATVCSGGLFGYRFVYPAMRVGRHEVYWQRPLAGFWAKGKAEPTWVDDAPPGYLTAYRADQPRLDRPVELWPRLLKREVLQAALTLLGKGHDPHCFQDARNVRKLFDVWLLRGEHPVEHNLARQLVTLRKHETLEQWLEALPERAGDRERGGWLVEELRRRIEPEPRPLPKRPRSRVPASLTFGRTAQRSYEVAYWKTIALLAEGRYRNKNNADCVLDHVTQKFLPHCSRDLEALGDYLLGYYRKVIARAGMTGKALAGDLPFTWKTDFDFSWSGGWRMNQEGQPEERDLIVVIPGRDRKRAVIMADHYDTAYMADDYEEPPTKGARLAAAGADDNHSATTALMLGAPIFLELSRQGKLGCDVWLIHLTGEEFPADCLGARHLCQWLVEGNLRLRLDGKRWRDLSAVQVQGVYVLDMVAHNNPHALDVFQIAPGSGPQSFQLAYEAHRANETWNASVPVWNKKAGRAVPGRSRRILYGHDIPPVAPHLALSGEVRQAYDPRSTLYNTDGQIFSDAGVPVVLFMENYDINRAGYHDRHDTMANIDLDYGAALSAIAIESVARATQLE